MFEHSLDGKFALVTGCASGMGRSTALILADAGAAVAMVDRDQAGLEETAARIKAKGGRCSAHALDLIDTDAIPGMVLAVLAEFGRIDILVNTAGIADAGRTVLDLDMETWERVQTIDLKAPFRLMQETARHMVERGGGGKIVNVSSSSSFRGKRTSPAYSSAKSGLNQLTRCAAAEFGPHGINVNTVVPGMTNTAMIKNATHDLVKDGPLGNFFGRISEAEDVANVIVFLCTDAARQMTGQAVHVSAGAVL